MNDMIVSVPLSRTVLPPPPQARPGPVPTPNFQAIKARQRETWESGDFAQVAKIIVPVAEDFMARLSLRAGGEVLDVACGSGNLAVIAAHQGCRVKGVDFAANLVAQAKVRAQEAGLEIDFVEGDAEALPYPDNSFDVVVSMFGVMFTPRPGVIVSELCRVTRPGGMIALANWSPTGFIGKMFEVFGRYVPAPAGLPSPLQWGDPTVVRDRFDGCVENLRLTPRIARMQLPFGPAGTVEFFRRYYGPTVRAFNALGKAEQHALFSDLVELQARHNISPHPGETDTPAEYLEVQARVRK